MILCILPPVAQFQVVISRCDWFTSPLCACCEWDYICWYWCVYVVKVTRGYVADFCIGLLDFELILLCFWGATADCGCCCCGFSWFRCSPFAFRISPWRASSLPTPSGLRSALPDPLSAPILCRPAAIPSSVGRHMPALIPIMLLLLPTALPSHPSTQFHEGFFKIN